MTFEEWFAHESRHLDKHREPIRIAWAWAREGWEARQKEIDDLKWQRDQFEKAAKDWMADYDKLREKYEGPYIIGQRLNGTRP